MAFSDLGLITEWIRLSCVIYQDWMCYCGILRSEENGILEVLGRKALECGDYNTICSGNALKVQPHQAAFAARKVCRDNMQMRTTTAE